MDWQYVFSMAFNNFDVEDAGNYTLELGNAYGNSSSTFYIGDLGKMML